MEDKNLAILLKETAHKIKSIMKLKVDEYGLTFGLLHVLKLIEKYPDSNQKKIAEEMRFTEGAMSMTTKKLTELGLVKKVSLKTDMRYHKLTLTDKGRQVLKDYEEYHNKIINDIFDGFNEKEIVILYNFISRVNENIKNILIREIE